MWSVVWCLLWDLMKCNVCLGYFSAGQIYQACFWMPVPFSVKCRGKLHNNLLNHLKKSMKHISILVTLWCPVFVQLNWGRMSCTHNTIFSLGTLSSWSSSHLSYWASLMATSLSSSAKESSNLLQDKHVIRILLWFLWLLSLSSLFAASPELSLILMRSSLILYNGQPKCFSSSGFSSVSQGRSSERLARMVSGSF